MDPSVGAIEPSRALRAVAAVCTAAVPLVLAIPRSRDAALPAVLGLAAIAGTTLVLLRLLRGADTVGKRIARAVALFAIGVFAAVVGLFLGPHTQYSAVIALALMLLGVSSTSGRDRLAWLPAWAGCAGLVGGQATVATLMTLGVIPDESLVPLSVARSPSVPLLLLSTAAFVGWSLVGFAAVRRFRERYRLLALEVDEAARAAAIREALLEEARHEYMRALRSGRTGGERDEPTASASRPSAASVPAWMIDTTLDLREPDRTLPDAGSRTEPRAPPRDDAPRVAAPNHGERTIAAISLPERRPSTPPAGAAAGSRSWAGAYRQKLRVQQAFVVLGCVAGIVMSYFLGSDSIGRARAAIGLCIVAAMALLHGALVAPSGRDTVHWPWVVVAAASGLIASAFGIHGILSSFIVMVVFLGGLFRGRDEASGINRRSAVIVALCGSHLVLFVLLYFEIIEDHAVLPMRVPGMGPFEPVVQHAILQGCFIAAFLVSGVVDRAFRRLRDLATAAAEEAAVQEALLADASAKLAQVERAMSEGLFAGQRVGRFALRGRRASGGMGDIYDAVDDRTGDRVAVKLVRVDVVSDPTVLELFAREVAALRRVESTNVARVLDAGGLDVGLPYVAMELIEGPSLAETLTERGVLSNDEARALIRDVTRGLDALHRSLVVHRDIKPQNILRASRAEDAPWKIVDLGIAHVGGPLDERPRFAMVGTRRYMAPEQFGGGDLDGRADLYALTLVLYRALTGHQAFSGARRENDALSSPRDPRRLAPISEDVAHVLRIGCASRREDRFANAAAFREAFDAALDGRLDPRLQAHARSVLEQEPWGADPPHETRRID